MIRPFRPSHEGFNGGTSRKQRTSFAGRSNRDFPGPRAALRISGSSLGIFVLVQSRYAEPIGRGDATLDSGGGTCGRNVDPCRGKEGTLHTGADAGTWKKKCRLCAAPPLH